MNNYFFKKEESNDLLDCISKELISNKNQIEKAFDIDYKEWEVNFDFNIFINQIEEAKNKKYLPYFSKEKIVDGFGKISLLCNQNPYLIFNFILSCIYTNNKLEVVLENKKFATNKAIIESIKKVLKDKELEDDTISYIELTEKENIIEYQDNYNLIYYFGNKYEYLNFAKRLHVPSKFEECEEISIFSDSEEFEEELEEVDKWAYLNEVKINFYDNLKTAISEINKNNLGKGIAVVYSKDINKITKFIKYIKAEKIYVNKNPIYEYKEETNLENLVYEKNIKW